MPSHPRVPAVLLLAGLLAALAGTAEGQEGPTRQLSQDQVRVGLALGGTGFLGLITEYRRGDWSAELIVGTISFREIGVALSGKRYFSDGSLRPAVGAGFWSLAAWSEDGRGSILLARIPIAAEWRFSGEHSAGIEVGLNRALAVNRLDPEDDTPPHPNVVPIPGAYYRFGWSP